MTTFTMLTRTYFTQFDEYDYAELSLLRPPVHMYTLGVLSVSYLRMSVWRRNSQQVK